MKVTMNIDYILLEIMYNHFQQLDQNNMFEHHNIMKSESRFLDE